MILASCLALLIALAPACVVSQTITSVTLVSFNPQYPRVDELYRCDIVMNPVATGSYTFTYEWLLQLPLPSTQDAFVYPGGSSATLPSDLKSITSTMAPYKHMRLSCRVTARTASTNALIGTTTSAVTTLGTTRAHNRTESRAARLDRLLTPRLLACCVSFRSEFLSDHHQR